MNFLLHSVHLLLDNKLLENPAELIRWCITQERWADIAWWDTSCKMLQELGPGQDDCKTQPITLNNICLRNKVDHTIQLWLS